MTLLKPRTFAAIVVFAVMTAIFVTACGSPAQSPSSTGAAKASPTPTATPSPTPTPGPAHSGQTSVQIMQGLKAHGLPIGAYFNYTAANDVNKLLGRPGQYIGKLNFKDTRISSSDQGVDISVPDGGSIEVFANTTDAKNRFTYIQSISKSGVALFAEYEYLDGVAILRISPQLTPAQAVQYEAAFKALK
ncbi:MAG TPA: hypothetical protein VNE61_05970 [Ktedonobacteraceae bacterium]|nr:hypothetical protein [Ktedonobacteraceae bacterium]